ncbi:MAG TPA: AAA family ATPase [Solirubrobacteraceae bacterium]|nr:AAA family ATPase [Solirubrobacteraceae bacterium]
MSALQILVALDGEVDRGLIETIVTRDPQMEVLDYLELDGPTASGLGSGDALVVAVADYTAEARDFVVKARRQHGPRPIVLMCPTGSGGYLHEAFSNGVDDIVALALDGSSSFDPALPRQLAFTLEKAIMRKRGTVELKDEKVRNVICVLGLKGGSGKTLTSVNLAVALAESGHSCAILDLDLQFGDVALAMGLSPARTIYDLVRSGGSLDADKLDDFLLEHHSGARALVAPVRPDQAAMITVPFLSEVQRLLGEMFEFVVIDTPPSFAPEVISSVDSSNDVLVVAMRDTLSLKNTKLGLETLERMEYDRRRVKILLNRANTNVGIEREDVLAILGRDVDVLVPSHRDITRSVNQGQPIALQRGAEAGKAFRALAEMYVEAANARDRGENVAQMTTIVPEASDPASQGRQSIFRRRRSA